MDGRKDGEWMKDGWMDGGCGSLCEEEEGGGRRRWDGGRNKNITEGIRRETELFFFYLLFMPC